MATVFSRERAGGKLAWYTKLKDHTGKWRQVLLKGVKGEPQAQKLADELEKQQDRLNKGLEPGKRFRGTFSELCEFAFEVHFKRMRSVQGDRSRIDCHAGPNTELGKLPASRVTSAELEKYFNAYSESTTVRGTRPSGDTINRIRATLSRVFTVAHEQGIWPDSNPAEATKKRDVVHQTHSILKAHEIAPVLEQVSDYWRGCVAVGLLSGLRKGEILALRKSDVDLERRAFTVQRSNEYAGTKGSKRPESVPIHEALVPYLEPWLETPGPLLFPNRDGEQRGRTVHTEKLVRVAMVRAGICEWYDHKCRRKGCRHVERHADAALRCCPVDGMKLWAVGHARHVRFHDTRHTFASHALMSGVPMQSVQKILRHKDPRLTVNTYGHLDAGHLAEQVNRFSPPGLARPAQPGVGPSRDAHAREHLARDCKVTDDEPSGFGAPVVRAERSAGRAKSDASPDSGKTARVRSSGARAQTPDACIVTGPPLLGTVAQASQALDSTDAIDPFGSTGLPPVAPSPEGLGAPVVRIQPVAHHAIRNATPGGEPPGTAGMSASSLASPWLTVSEVAHRLRVSTHWVYRELAAQHLGHQRVGSRIRVPVDELDAYLRRFPGLRVAQPVVVPPQSPAQQPPRRKGAR